MPRLPRRSGRSASFYIGGESPASGEALGALRSSPSLQIPRLLVDRKAHFLYTETEYELYTPVQEGGCSFLNSRRKGTTIVAVIGAVLLVLILVFGTMWMGSRARIDTETAVHSVSVLYLDELAGRREQVVADNLREKVNVIHTALDLMTEEDLSDSAHLQAYQANIKRLFRLERFAFVGTDNLIYTSNGVRAEIDQYQIDYHALKDTEIAVENPDSADKKIIIAVPTRLRFADTELIACFMQLDMQEMLSGVSMNNQDGSTFCNIYTRDGIALSNTVLGGLAMEDNLLEAMRNAAFEKGYSFDRFVSDFTEGKRSVVSFTYDGIRETLSFVPVEGTDWLLTYLIRESVISDSISTISQGIIRRSIVQSLLTIAVLLLLFAFIFRQTRRNSQLALEKETADAENRVKQAEMEQR